MKELMQLLRNRPDGLPIGELAEETGTNRRTLLRHLRGLMEEGKITRKGQGRATVYLLIDKTPLSPSTRTLNESTLDHLKQPLSLRKPTGYDHNFLASYTPNSTSYFSQSELAKLEEIGSLDDEEQPAGTYARKILDRLLIDLSWNSSRLEGNTYSLLDTEKLLLLGQPNNQQEAFETQMLINHKSAIEFLVDSANEIEFNRRTLLNLHALLADLLLENPIDVGRLRQHSVGIHGSAYIPLENPHLINDRFEEFVAKANAIQNPYEQSFFALVHIPYIQPFADVNKRVARLASNIPLIRRNRCPLSFIDVSRDDLIFATLAIYELNQFGLLKEVYIQAYEKSAERYRAVQTSLGPPDMFKMRHRDAIKRVGHEVISECLGKVQAEEWIAQFASANIPASEQEMFIKLVRQEIHSTHEGNFARFKIRPSEFDRWQSVWNA